MIVQAASLYTTIITSRVPVPVYNAPRSAFLGNLYLRLPFRYYEYGHEIWSIHPIADFQNMLQAESCFQV